VRSIAWALARLLSLEGSVGVGVSGSRVLSRPSADRECSFGPLVAAYGQGAGRLFGSDFRCRRPGDSSLTLAEVQTSVDAPRLRRLSAPPCLSCYYVRLGDCVPSLGRGMGGNEKTNIVP
jgi:hypothetical protein